MTNKEFSMTTVKESGVLCQLASRDNPNGVYSHTGTPKEQTLANEWQKMEEAGWQFLGNEFAFFSDDNVPTNGFQGHAYRSPEGKIHVVFRGTDQISDFDDDIQLALGFKPDQAISAEQFTKLVLKEFGHDQDSLFLVGHSLGGYLAQLVAKAINDKVFLREPLTAHGITFNAPGIHLDTFEINEDKTFINFNLETDRVSHAGGAHYGDNHDIDGMFVIPELLSSHFIANFNEVVSCYDNLKNTAVDALFDMSDSELQQLLVLAPEGREKLIQIRREDAQEAREQREAFPDVLATRNALDEAIQSGDELDIFQEGLRYLSSLDHMADLDKNGLISEEAESVIDIFQGLLDIGDAVRTEDWWSAVGNGLGLVGDINSAVMLDPDSEGFLDPEVSSLIAIASGAINLSRALEEGDHWGISKYSLEVAQSINLAYKDEGLKGLELGSDRMGDVLTGAASALSLAITIRDLDDIFESGDSAQIAYSVLSTYNDVINTYNGIAAAVNTGQAALPLIDASVMGYIAAGIQLVNGDTAGAAVTTACIYLNTIPGYGQIAAAILSVGYSILGREEPPEAAATFSLDENGNVVMNLHGDSEMQATVESIGSQLIGVLQQYKDTGGRLLIHETMPVIRAEIDEDPRIDYTSDSGGKMSVILDGSSSVTAQMLGVLNARDKGERLDSAIQLATDKQGNVDLRRVDAVMAGYGFTKKGFTYTTGETGDRHGQSWGTGVFSGGGNAGPEGKLFTSTGTRPLGQKPEQQPGYRLGEVIKNVSLSNMFTSPGNELLAMALGIGSGVAGIAAAAEVADASISAGKSIGPTGPMSPFELNETPQQPANDSRLPGEDEVDSRISSGDARMDQPSIEDFLERHWPEILDAPDNPVSIEDYWYHFHEELKLIQPQPIPTPSTPDSDDEQFHYPADLVSGELNVAFISEPERTFTAHQAEPEVEQEPLTSESSESQPLPQGPVFTMAEDTILRCQPMVLAEDVQAGGYVTGSEQYRFGEFKSTQNGRVWLDDNGDVRFEPTPGYTGDASFTYTVISPDGGMIEKTATINVTNVNDSPVLVDDAYWLDEGEMFQLGQLLDNDTDQENDTLVIDHFRGLENGRIEVIDGRFVFVPEPGFHGEVEFSYWVIDHAGEYPVMGTVNLVYADIDTAPAAADDRFLILEDTELTATVAELLENDVDHDGSSLTFIGLDGASHGSVEQLPDGTIRFIPEDNYSGSEAGFSYQVADEAGNIATARVTVEVIDTREPPIITNTTLAPILEDEPLVFSPDKVVAFTFDADGDQVHLEMIDNVVGGTIVTINGYPAFLPDPEYSGPASFDYRATDNKRGTVEGHLEFMVQPVNDPIKTGDDSFTTEEEQTLAIAVSDLLANDLDVDGDVIEFKGVDTARHGTVELAQDGSILFTPDSNYHGSDAGFSYTVSDSEGLISSGWVQVEVVNLNDAPVFTATSLELQEDEPLVFSSPVLATLATDPDGDTLTVSSAVAIFGGTFSESGGLFTFTPDQDYYGQVAIQLTLSDGNGESVTSRFDLNIQAVDDPAAFGAHTLLTLEDQHVDVFIADIMANNNDIDGPLTFDSLAEEFHGTASITDSGEIRFVPDPDYFGIDAGFSYTVVDAMGNRATGHVTIEVEGVNDFPRIIATTLESPEDSRIDFTDEMIGRFLDDPDGETPLITSIEAVHGGTVSREGDHFTFTPDTDYDGTATLAYSAVDNAGETISGLLDIDLLKVDDATLFGDDTFRIREEEALNTSISELMANDFDPDGPLSFVRLGEARHGHVTIRADGEIEFVPETDYFGNDAGFFYTVQDGDGNLANGWVTVEVENVEDKPVITADRLYLQEDQLLVLDPEQIAGFLHDPDGESMALDMVAEVEGGRLELQDGLYTFIPDDNHYGEAGFSYTAVNGSGDTISGALSLGILAVNDLPVVQPLTLSGIEDQTISLVVSDLLALGGDIEDGSNLKFDGIESSTGGIVHIADGAACYIPDQNFFGAGSFTYRLSDSEGGIGYGEVFLEIAAVNDTPVAGDDHLLAWSNGRYENVYSPGMLLENDLDVDGDTLTIVGVGEARYGTVAMDSSGNISYLAHSTAWVGVDRFSYTISDGNGQTSVAVVELDVRINTSPDVYPELLFSKEDEILHISQEELLANDSDIDGDTFRIIGVDQAEHCSVELLDDGTIRFIPEHNYNDHYPGQASFRYTVTDGISGPVTGVAFFSLEPVNDAPILTGEVVYGAVEDNHFSFHYSELLANDYDVEMASPYEEDAIFFNGVGSANNGRISFDRDSGMIFYTPDPNFCRYETFNYSVIDSHGAESVVQSKIWVEPVNDLPVVQYDMGEGECSVWNHYSIASLVGNDYDVDGDRLTIVRPYVIEGSGGVRIEGGNLSVRPAFQEDRMVIGYTVSDGNGGEVHSRLDIPNIREHNFAPEFRGVRVVSHYASTWEYGNDGNDASLWEQRETIRIGFDVFDRNGSRDIIAITPAGFSSNLRFSSLEVRGSEVYFQGTSDYKNSGSPTPYWDHDWHARWTVTATDRGGATGTAVMQYKGKFGGGSVSFVYTPVVFDLDGDGVELIDIDHSPGFDWNGDGEIEKSGWVGGDDGILVYDYNNDSRIEYADELSFVSYLPGATTDLEGLRAFDSNNDGRFDGDDEKWQSFGIWQDLNSDGITDEGEFTRLEEQGISYLELDSDGEYRDVAGNSIYGTTVYGRDDGTTGEAADVGLSGEIISANVPDEQAASEQIAETVQQTANEPVKEESLDRGDSEEITGEAGDEGPLEPTAEGTSADAPTTEGSESGDATGELTVARGESENEEVLITDEMIAARALLNISDMATKNSCSAEESFLLNGDSFEAVPAELVSAEEEHFMLS